MGTFFFEKVNQNKHLFKLESKNISFACKLKSLDHYTTFKKSLEKFNCFSECQISEFYNLSVARTIKKKQLILRQGQICDFVFVVLQGSLRVYNPDNYQNLNFFVEGEWATEHDSFIKQQPSINVIEAMENTEIAIVSIQKLHKLIEKDPAYLILGRLLGGLIRPEQLLCANITPLEKYKQLMQNRPDWILRFSQKNLASYLNMSPETLSRLKRNCLFS